MLLLGSCRDRRPALWIGVERNSDVLRTATLRGAHPGCECAEKAARHPWINAGRHRVHTQVEVPWVRTGRSGRPSSEAPQLKQCCAM
jgi:hypothetical protein